MNKLLLDKINEKSPYKVIMAENGDYLFSTDKGVNYAVSLTEEFELGGCMGYQFGLRNVDHVHGSYDFKIRQTVLAIIKEFFRRNLNVLLYVCDTSDSRERVRNRLFLRWFERDASKNNYAMFSANSVVEGEGFYAAIIVETRNPLFDEIVKDFEKTKEVLEK